MLWSVIVVKLKSVGFKFSEAQEFWLTALLALTGATLRIFYAFAVPVFGGRNWTVITTASLLLPCLGIGIAVQNQGPEAEAAARRDAAKEASATLGFTSAIGAYGGFIIPITFGAAIKSGSPQTALLAFLVFYLTCVAITWWYYHRKGAETPC
jgi:nitrate/nitrite transporter NarK